MHSKRIEEAVREGKMNINNEYFTLSKNLEYKEDLLDKYSENLNVYFVDFSLDIDTIVSSFINFLILSI
jgi:hypothetical protein